jgi:hypothetical protein
MQEGRQKRKREVGGGGGGSERRQRRLGALFVIEFHFMQSSRLNISSANKIRERNI